MKKLRSALALLLCLALSLTLTPAAFAEEPTGDYLVWEETPAANEAAPVIEIQPQNTTAADGTQTTFSVTAAGGSLKYQWQYRTSSSGSWTNSTSTSGKTKNYTVNARTAIDGYQYRCRVSNSAGTVYTSVVTLTVSSSSVSKPVITQQPTNFSAPNGTQTTISVTATGTELQYLWQYRKNSSSSWTNSRIFTVNARTSINGYQYRCRVSNSAGEVYTNVVTLTVTSPSAIPTITTQPRSVTAADGTPTTFIIDAIGTDLNYQWQYRTSSSGSWKDSTAESGKTDEYTVNARTAINGYQYRCKVSNAAGTAYSNVVTLTVATKPVITTQPKSITAPDGATVTMSVEASGVDLSYQWQCRDLSGASWRDADEGGAKTNTISLNASNISSVFGYREYRCIVSNIAGTVYSDMATLRKMTAPTITTQPQSVTAAAGTTATFTIAASGDGLNYQWQYCANESGAWVDSSATSGKTKTYTVNARAAIDGYQYRCKVSNSAGTVYSSIVTLTVVTKPTITTQPTNVTAADGTTATFTVAASGTGLSYQWQYRTSASGAWKDSTSPSGKMSAYTVNARAAINGYQYRCKVSNSAGTVYSSIVTLTVATTPTITTQPTNVTAAAGTTATFTIAASGTDLQYQWQYRVSASSAWMDTTEAGGKTNTYTVNARAAINGYQYRCRVYNAAGEVYSDVVTLSTHLDPPTITAATVMGTMVTLTWSAVPAAASYTVYLAKSGDALEAHESGITGTTLTISGLDKNTSYNFAVDAVADALTARSTAVTVTTEDITYRALLIGEENFSKRCTRNRGDVGLMSNMLSSVKGPDGGRYSIETCYDVDNSAIHSAIFSTFSGADSDDVSLFFIASHGVTSDADGTYAGALLTLVNGGPSTEYLPLETLASWLGLVPGKVIVILGSCGSGAAVFEGADSQNGIAANAAQADPDAFNEAVVQAFAGEDRLVLSGEHTYYFGENGGDATLQFNLGDFCTSKFYVLTASRHQELSWGSERERCNIFTKHLIAGVSNTMPADTDGDSAVTLHELFLYIKENATGPYVVSGVTYYQNVQEYPKNSSYKLFKK